MKKEDLVSDKLRTWGKGVPSLREVPEEHELCQTCGAVRPVDGECPVTYCLSHNSSETNHAQLDSPDPEARIGAVPFFGLPIRLSTLKAL